MAVKQKKGQGGIFKRNGVFYGRITINGKRIIQTLRTTSEREARARYAEMIEPLALKTQEQALENVRRKLDDNQQAQAVANVVSLSLANAWITFETSPERKQCANNTLDMYRSQWERFAKWATARHGDGVQLKEITRADALAFMAEIGRTQSGGTYNKYAALLKRVWQIIGESAGATINPWQKIARRDNDAHRRRALTLEELADVLAAADSIGRTTGLMFRLGIYTGLRMGDVCNITWGDIDLARGVISLIPHKTKRHGTRVVIPIHPKLMSALIETPAKERRGRVLDIANETAAGRMVNSVFDTAKIERHSDIGREKSAVDVGFHSLRHTFVSMAGNAGIPLAIVQSIVGHTDKEMTEHYFHASIDAQRAAVASLPNIGTAAEMTIDAESVETTQTNGGAESWARFESWAQSLTPAERKRAIDFLQGLQ